MSFNDNNNYNQIEIKYTSGIKASNYGVRSHANWSVLSSHCPQLMCVMPNNGVYNSRKIGPLVLWRGNDLIGKNPELHDESGLDICCLICSGIA